MGFASHVCECNFRSCIWALQMNLILVVVLRKIGTQQYKNQCKNLLRFFEVVFGGMVIKHKILWGIPKNRTPVPVSTLFSEMCGSFMSCPMSTFTLGDTSEQLTFRTPLFWPPRAGRHLLPEHLAPRALCYH
jgi:hypothetical protein